MVKVDVKLISFNLKTNIQKQNNLATEDFEWGFENNTSYEAYRDDVPIPPLKPIFAPEDLAGPLNVAFSKNEHVANAT